jgi:hypothetical protein
VNLRDNPQVILMTGCNQWDSGLDIVVEGEAVEVMDEELLKRKGADQSEIVASMEAVSHQ